MAVRRWRYALDIVSLTRAFEPRELLSIVPYLRGATVVREERNTLRCAVDRGGEVRVSFFGGLPLRRIDDPDVAQNRVQVASLLDLAGCKAEVVQHRAEAKDYRDIAALLAAGVGLEMILAAGRAVYGAEFVPSRTLRALTFFEDGNLPELEQHVRAQLRGAVAAVNLEQLPALAGREGLTRQENER